MRKHFCFYVLPLSQETSKYIQLFEEKSTLRSWQYKLNIFSILCLISHRAFRLDLDQGVSEGDPEGQSPVWQRCVHDKKRDGGTVPGDSDREAQGSSYTRAGAGEGEAEGQRLQAGPGLTKPAADGGTETVTAGKILSCSHFDWLSMSAIVHVSLLTL